MRGLATADAGTQVATAHPKGRARTGVAKATTQKQAGEKLPPIKVQKIQTQDAQGTLTRK